jgi:hypothetical protein
MKERCKIKIGRQGVKKINRLIRSGILYLDENNCVHGITRYIKMLDDIRKKNRKEIKK